MNISDVVNEGSTAYLDVLFKDKDGVVAAPSGVTYRIDCMTTGQQVLADTVISPAGTVEITLTPGNNAIITATNRSEIKRVTVSASYGASDAINKPFDYLVQNLSGV